MEGEVAPERPFSSLSMLEKLPLHALASICTDLAGHEFSRRSLFAFSLTSKTCCSASEQERFRRVRLTAETPKKLRLDVQRWRAILATGNRMEYVRLLKASGYIVRDGEEYQRMKWMYEAGYPHTYPETLPGEQEQKIKEWDDTCVPGMDRNINEYHYSPPDLPPTKEDFDTIEAAWQPLAELCRALPRLQDIVYAGLDQMPWCLLRAIHEAHPESNLHITHFRLRTPKSPIQPADQVKWEREIVTSPCLRSITAANTQEFPSHLEGASIMHIAHETAPKLRHVYNWEPLCFPTARDGFPFSLHKVEEGDHQPRLGQLETLHIRGRRHFEPPRISLDTLRAWTNHTDFRVLRSLRLEEPIRQDTLDYLVAIARDGLFTALRSLSLKLDASAVFVESTSIDTTVSDLLLALNPLEELRLRGFVGEAALGTIIDRHARTLQKFRFSPVRRQGLGLSSISLHDFRKIAERGLYLEELEIIVPRLQGSEVETAIYRHIGSLPRLRKLKLLLDCTISDMIAWNKKGVRLKEVNGAEEYAQQEYPREHFSEGTIVHILPEPVEPLWGVEYYFSVLNQPRNALLNAATDYSLALDIFQEVMRSSKTVQKVELQPCGWYIGDKLELPRFGKTFSSAMRCLGRGWIMEKTVWDAEIKMHEKTKRLKYAKEDMIRDSRSCSKGRALVEAAWEELWPGPRSDSWLDDWSSFPLTRNDEGAVS